jgi:hypothetical protein
MSRSALGLPPGALAPGAAPEEHADGGAALDWTFNPWRERPGAAALAAVAALGMCLAITRMGESAVLTVALCLAAVGALAPLIVPTRCRVDPQGVARLGPTGWRRRSWSEISRGTLGPTGLLVSPYARRHWLDATRGLFLPLPARARETLIARIQPRLLRHGL